jgi:hypothetical protein
MALPPIHRVDHTPCLILPEDSAWDAERIKREQDEIEAARLDPAKSASCQWPQLEDHPIQRYISGASRFDLRTVEQYLKPDSDPVRFTLRRLDDDGPWQQVLHMQEQGRNVAARRFAMRNGLVEVSGLDIPLRIDPEHPLDAAMVNQLRGRITDHGISTIGAAVINVSREVFDAEKKR